MDPSSQTQPQSDSGAYSPAYQPPAPAAAPYEQQAASAPMPIPQYDQPQPIAQQQQYAQPAPQQPYQPPAPVAAAQPQPFQQVPQPYLPPTPPAPAIAPIPQPILQQPPAQSGQGPVVGGGPTPPVQPGVKPAQSNPNSTQNTLQIAEIRDGIVIMSDGSFRSVVMIKSINFDLMSPQEQEAVEFSYQAFLNSLYFPIQIFIRSQRIDLQPYIEKLDKIRSEHDNMLLALLMEDYIGYIDQLSQQTNIMDKKFYIVIPYFPHADIQKALSQSKNFLTGIMALFDSKEQHVVINEEDLEKAKTELRNRVQSVLSGLLQCTIQGLPLDTQELIELFYDTYNPDTATRQQLKSFNNLNADVITKGAGAATQPHLQRELQ